MAVIRFPEGLISEMLESPKPHRSLFDEATVKLLPPALVTVNAVSLVDSVRGGTSGGLLCEVFIWPWGGGGEGYLWT